MIKNKLYAYGESVQIPSHLHFGQYMFEKMMEHNHLVALVNSDTGESMTFAELAQMTVDVALSLARMGVRKGDVISICSEKKLEVMPTILGIMCAGATYSLTDITYGYVPLLHRVKMTQPKIMFCSKTAFDQHKSLFDTVGCIQGYIVYDDAPKTMKDVYLTEPQHGQHPNLPQAEANLQSRNVLAFKDFLTETSKIEDFLAVPVDGWKDILLIVFSSGTTGLPKGVPWTHLGLLINIMSFTNESFKGHGFLNTREWYYTYGLLYTLATLAAGATVVYSDRNEHADCLAAIQKYKIRYLQMTPGTVTELIKSPVLGEYDLSSVHGIVSSSSVILAEQVRAVKDRLPSLRGVYQVYGASEAGCVCTELHAPHGPRDGSAGTPSYGFVLKVVDLETRQPMGAGIKGEICFQSPTLTPGYLGIQNRDHLDEEGFYKTGDIGYYDDDGYLYVVGRLKELIKYKDTSIVPAELESILLQHPGVKEVGVVGAPHDVYGEAPTACVVLQEGARAGAEELVEFLESRLTNRASPSSLTRLAGGVRFLDVLPRGAMGKLDRNKLKGML